MKKPFPLTHNSVESPCIQGWYIVCRTLPVAGMFMRTARLVLGDPMLST